MLVSRNFLILVTLAPGSLLISTPALAQLADGTKRATPVFRPETFFLGRTEGTGRLKIMFGRHRLVHVHGQGGIDDNGALVLNQDIEQAGKPPKHRRWVMRSLGSGQYAATLSDATGPVIGDVQGSIMRLAFPAKGGLRIRQTLTLSNDGQTARNRLTIRKMGIVVATLNETIRRVP